MNEKRKYKNLKITYSILFFIIEFIIIYGYKILSDIGNECWLNCYFDNFCISKNVVCQKELKLNQIFMQIGSLLKIIPLTIPVVSILCSKKENNKKKNIIICFIIAIVWEIVIWYTYILASTVFTHLH